MEAMTCKQSHHRCGGRSWRKTLLLECIRTFVAKKDPPCFGFPIFSMFSSFLSNDEPGGRDAARKVFSDPGQLNRVCHDLNGVGANQVANLEGLGLVKHGSLHRGDAAFVQLFEGGLRFQEAVV